MSFELVLDLGVCQVQRSSEQGQGSLIWKGVVHVHATCIILDATCYMYNATCYMYNIV